jgi:hydrogenase expression/formation protein HypC
MCLAIPGKIVKIEGDIASVDYEAEIRKAKLITNDVDVGDYVFVQAGIVVQKIPKQEAIKALEGWKEILQNDKNER